MTPAPRDATKSITVLTLLALGLGVGIWSGLGGLRQTARRDAGARATDAHPVDLAAQTGMPPADPASLALGADVYGRHCAPCHGAAGEGQPEWKVARPDGSLPAPPHDASGHTWHHADADLLRIIREGGTFYMPNSEMPAFGEVLTGGEIAAVLSHIKTMWGPNERAFQDEQTRNKETASP